ncbi:PREDICTED: RPE-retinal G protein-coupled receptor [Crocodylus porosus]|uniref:RPE-retinal G protein-coupled receptor n=1 Tax=Crocodylus porosus TaxID=8502 RepID=A0A7M4EUF1_CROPO|nr:PREDICTED: RPE-retinal G protein-coupled receptor [Crocodylus porosus]XP_019411867.1 PREDICTED: RPE-retinal G protein-coupled receptor [Crocodylus porosus]
MVTSYPLPEGFTELEVFAIGTILLVEALLGFCLNGLTIVSFRKIKELQTPGNLPIVSVALADCGICINAFIASFSSFLRYWPYGTDGCQIHGFQGFLTSLASISSSAVVAWDRYHHYCSRRQVHWSTSISLVIFVWLFSAFWSVMPLLGWGEYNYEPLRTCCTLDYSKGDRNYVTFLFALAIFNFLIPGFIMLTAYQSVEHKFKRIGQFEFNTGLPVKTLIICWGPYCLLYFYAAVQNVTFIPLKLQMVPAIIAKTSPTMNAFLYSLGNENYRGGIWQFLTGQKVEKAEVNNKIK